MYKGLISYCAILFTPITIPKATKGTMTVNILFVWLLNSKAEIAPVQRPIIMLPQYIEIYGAIFEEGILPKSACFNNSPKLEPMETSAPTYTNKASIPKTN